MRLNPDLEEDKKIQVSSLELPELAPSRREQIDEIVAEKTKNLAITCKTSNLI